MNRPRHSKISRSTKETVAEVDLLVDVSGKISWVGERISLLEHMLFSFCRMGIIDLGVTINSDDLIHHTAENIAIKLCSAFKKALVTDAQFTKCIHSEHVVQGEVLTRRL